MRIFIGGPTDVQDEINLIRAICTSLKPTLAVVTGEEADIVDWGQLAPAQGNAQQSIFDQSRFHDTDVFVFLFWHRFGRPPGVGISEWRSRRSYNAGKAVAHHLPLDEKIPSAHLLPYQGGTEAEVEAALAAIAKPLDATNKQNLTFDQKRRRIMVYWCDRDIPQADLKLPQLEMLRDYFENRLSNELFYSRFSTSEQLAAQFHGHILDAAHSVTKLEKRAHRGLMELEREYSDNEKDPSKRNMVQHYIARECQSAAKIVEAMANQDRQSCEMRTTDLYDRILEIMRSAESIQIIDLDYRRWNELLNPDDRIYSLNYSEEIVSETAQRARELSSFKIERIFAVRSNDINDSVSKQRLLKVLDKLQTRIAQEPDVQTRLKPRVLVDDEAFVNLAIKAKLVDERTPLTPAKFRAISKGLRETKDIVICTAVGGNPALPGSKMLLRENISFDSPQSAFETWGAISAKDKEVAAAEKIFATAWRIALPLESAIAQIQKHASAPSPSPAKRSMRPASKSRARKKA